MITSFIDRLLGWHEWTAVNLSTIVFFGLLAASTTGLLGLIAGIAINPCSRPQCRVEGKSVYWPFWLLVIIWVFTLLFFFTDFLPNLGK